MIKIAILMHGLGADGIDTLFANLSSYWDTSRFDITYLLAVDKGSKQFWEDRVLQNGIRVIHITDLDGKKLYHWPKSLAKALREYGPFDAIHVNMDMLNGINLRIAKKVGIRTRICHAHVSNNSAPDNFFKMCIKPLYLTVMKKWMKKHSTYRVACSNVAGDYFFGKGNYLTIFNGIDINKFRKSASKAKHTKKSVFCTVGRIDAPKNPFFIADIVNELYRINHDIKFIWIGSGGMDAEVKTYIENLPVKSAISFLGVRNDVEKILDQCSYFLFPSKYEGFGLVAVEAQAAGLDCFVSDTVPKDIDCGKCRFISLEKTPTEWAEEIMEYIQGEEKMKLDEEKLNRFDIKFMAERLQELYAKS